jgi:hypothetical protein
MPQDPDNYRTEDDFSRALAQNPNNKFVNAPKPKGRDTRVLATNSAGLGRNFKNIEEAYAEINRLKRFDAEKLDKGDFPPFKGTSSALRRRDAWADPISDPLGPNAIDSENKKARSMGFTSVQDYIDAIKSGIKRHEAHLPKEKDYGTTALGGSNGRSYPSQGKMSKLMEEDLKKKGGK